MVRKVGSRMGKRRTKAKVKGAIKARAIKQAAQT